MQASALRSRGVAAGAGNLVCVPPAGMGAYGFLARLRQPPEGVSVMQLPGREDRVAETPLDDIVEMARLVAVELAASTAGDYVLLGHSMGALVAFETVRALRREGLRLPRRLVVAACRAPDVASPTRVHGLPDAELIEALDQLGGWSDGVLASPELLTLVLRPLRADLRATELYLCRPEAPLPCPLTVLAGSDDASVSAEHLAAWASHTSAAFRLHRVPGNHFFVTERLPEVLELMETAP